MRAHYRTATQPTGETDPGGVLVATRLKCILRICVEYSQWELRGSAVFKQPSDIYLQLLARLDVDQ